MTFMIVQLQYIKDIKLDMQAKNQVEEAARPVVRMIEVNMAKCSRIIARINDTLSLHVYDDSIHYDIAELEKAVYQVSELRSKLISIKSDDKTSSLEYAVDSMITEAEDLQRTVILISRQTSGTLPPLHPINSDSVSSEGADEYEEEHTSMSDRPVLLTSSHTDRSISSASQNSSVSSLVQPAAHLNVEQCNLDSTLKTVGSTAANPLPSSITTSSCTVPGSYPNNSTVADSSAPAKQSTAYNPIAYSSASVKQSIPYNPILKSRNHGSAKQMNGASSAPANNVSSMQIPIYGHLPGPIMSTHTHPSYEPRRSGFIEQPSCESIVSYYAGNAAASSVAQSLSFDTGSNRMSKGVPSQFTPSPGYHTVGSSMLNVPTSNLTTLNAAPHSHYLPNQMSNRTGYPGQYLPPSVSQGIGVDSVNNTSIHNSNSCMMPFYGTQSRDNFSMYRPNVKVERTSLPKFSGSIRDWPEFKAVWQRLAEGSIPDPIALGNELQKAVRDSPRAWNCIKSIKNTRPTAYQFMFNKLCYTYENPSAIVTAALEDLTALQEVDEKDYNGLIELVDIVESCFSMLGEIGGLNHVSVVHVDKINDLLPTHIRTEWIHKFNDLPPEARLYPFLYYMSFLEKHRNAVIRLADQESKHNDKQSKGQSFHGKSKADKSSGDSRKFFKCAAHPRDGIKHGTSECSEFKKLTVYEKLEALKSINACFRCFGDHRRNKCQVNESCLNCGKDNHHVLMCREENKSDDNQNGDDKTPTAVGCTNKARAVGFSLYAIVEANIVGSDKTATVFCDDGSDTTYITHKGAQKLNAKRLGKYTLEVTTMGNIETIYKTQEYEISVRTQSGKIRKITAFGMDRITGPVSTLDEDVLKRLFPNYDVPLLQRKSTSVDILLGSNYFGLHPKNEVTSSGDNLSIMQGELGVCLQGSHPEICEGTKVDSNMVKLLHQVHVRSETHSMRHSHREIISHPEFEHPTINRSDITRVQSCTNITKSQEIKINTFIQGEELGTEINPRCGGCKCNKCPVIGHSYSFKEEQELNMIRNNLTYDEAKRCWFTSYPWTMDPGRLPNNYDAVLATLRSTERTLLKDSNWSKTYGQQIMDMEERGVSRKLTENELLSWQGPVYYLAHLAVNNPQSTSTPVRTVFNSSQVCKGYSLNSAVAKGPDAYINNLLGLLLRWREGNIALVGDIKKMFNSVHIHELEQHCHRFLWRNMEVNRDPDIYVMTRVNMGDRPAGAISTEAVYKTADLFREDSHRAAEILKNSTYVDDILDSFTGDKETGLHVAQEVEAMLLKGGFHVKYWQLSGEAYTRSGNELTDINMKKVCNDQDIQLACNTKETARVLGLSWNPEKDILLYKVSLNFSRKRKGVHTGPDILSSDIPKMMPSILTRRMVLGQFMRIFDPYGFLCPFTLKAKIYLRETWALKLGWDETLPDKQYERWMQFFKQMFHLEQLSYPRCLQPPDTVGDPWLIVLSDGSDDAYGFTAYIRWSLKTGKYWCRLIMAKCRIAPLTKLSTPQMELNAAVLSKRGRKVIEKECRFRFEKILNIVDSETVLCMLKKTSHRFHVYEGVRIGEIQAATNGDMSCWAWLAGHENIADWTTRGKSPQEIDVNSDWWNGPSVLYSPYDQWGLRFEAQKEHSPGEKIVKSMVNVAHASGHKVIDYSRFSMFKTVIWVIARIVSMFERKSLSGGNGANITPVLLRKAEDILLKDIQSSISKDMNQTNKKGKQVSSYRRLHPVKNENGIWIVGSRLIRFNPMSPDNTPQSLIPSKHPATRIMMWDAHVACKHHGRDSTLARFRQKYWTPHGSKIAGSVAGCCPMCKLKNARLLKQQMGLLPVARLKPGPAFNQVMLDIFGPYKVRGEVQKRITGKAYGVIFTDLTMRAVHIEAVFGCDTTSFLIAFNRFVSIRAYPATIYSDPGAQLVGASNELKETWSKLDKDAIRRKGTENGLSWVFGPADSPWHQGAVESLVKSAKRAIDITIHNQRLSVPEILTLFYEVANVMNERPIGSLPGADSELNMLTPNSLLLGRATAINPGGWQPEEASNVSRFNLIQNLADVFWKHWTELCAPSLVVHPRWHTSQRNLKPGDVVLVFDDSSAIRGEYRLAVVRQVYPGDDHKVRKVSLAYKTYKVGEKVAEYSGAKDQVITRSVQRLVLIVPVDQEETDIPDHIPKSS